MSSLTEKSLGEMDRTGGVCRARKRNARAKGPENNFLSAGRIRPAPGPAPARCYAPGSTRPSGAKWTRRIAARSLTVVISSLPKKVHHHLPAVSLK